MRSIVRGIPKEQIEAIAKKYELTFIVLFGSKARGEEKNEESDVDIAVLAIEMPDYKRYGAVFSALSDLFPGENVDVRFLNGTDLLFRFHVVKDGILLFGDKQKYLQYKLLTNRRYMDDGKKYFPLQDAFVLKKQEELEKRL